jgi:hypothetical protein
VFFATVFFCKITALRVQSLTCLVFSNYFLFFLLQS